MSYRLATTQEIERAGKLVSALEDYETAFEYAETVYGPSVHRIVFNIDHNFDDGEENRYVDSEDPATAYDAQGNPLQPVGEWSEYGDMPGFNTYEPWHMEFSRDEKPNVPLFYVQEQGA